MPITVKNLTHIYMAGSVQEAVALDNISLEIFDGEFLGIIGHTGSGKSTLVQHLNGLLQPTSGTVIVNGINLADKKTRKDVRRQVGMVFQYPEYQLFEETVAKDIAFGPRNVGIPEDQIDQCVKTAMQKAHLDYEEYAEKSPFELSGGEKRRVALAGILAIQPKVLVLDEPMAGLDPRGRQEILEFIRDLHASGMTVVMVSHNMDDIAELATRVAVMHQGRLALLGSPREIFSQGHTLQDLHLELPRAARMAQALRVRGVELTDGIYRIEELCEDILRRARHA